MTADFLPFPVPAGRQTGTVFIVGAGPGDPDLLTLRALRVLRDADVVIHDRLIGPGILDFAKPDAEVLYVGKAKANHSVPQDEINALMARRALAGKRVIRLKGGDPFVFGRGGEEVDYLMGRGVPVEIVPGITAATGCAAYAGIPLTHRDHATAVTFISGHAKDGDPDLDWDGLARGRQTIVVYMGISTSGRVAARLIEHGLSPTTPIAVVENGTLATQKVATGTVAGLEDVIKHNNIIGPALIVIGEVARFAKTSEPARRPLAVAE